MWFFKKSLFHWWDDWGNSSTDQTKTFGGCVHDECHLAKHKNSDRHEIAIKKKWSSNVLLYNLDKAVNYIFAVILKKEKEMYVLPCTIIYQE